MDAINEARAAFYANDFTRDPWTNGKTAEYLFWLHPTLRIWCRARPDFISNAFTHLNDHKATADTQPGGVWTACLPVERLPSQSDVVFDGEAKEVFGK